MSNGWIKGGDNGDDEEPGDSLERPATIKQEEQSSFDGFREPLTSGEATPTKRRQAGKRKSSGRAKKRASRVPRRSPAPSVLSRRLAPVRWARKGRNLKVYRSTECRTDGKRATSQFQILCVRMHRSPRHPLNPLRLRNTDEYSKRPELPQNQKTIPSSSAISVQGAPDPNNSDCLGSVSFAKNILRKLPTVQSVDPYDLPRMSKLIRRVPSRTRPALNLERKLRQMQLGVRVSADRMSIS